MLAYHSTYDSQRIDALRLQWRVLFLILAFLSLGFCYLSWSEFNPYPQMVKLVSATMFTVMGIGQVLALISVQDVQRFSLFWLWLRPISVLGYFSYPVYLFHNNVLRMILPHITGGKTDNYGLGVLYQLVYVCLCFIVGYLGLSLVDVPVHRWYAGWRKRSS